MDYLGSGLERRTCSALWSPSNILVSLRVNSGAYQYKQRLEALPWLTWSRKSPFGLWKIWSVPSVNPDYDLFSTRGPDRFQPRDIPDRVHGDKTLTFGGHLYICWLPSTTMHA